jgi:hypothetical protein
MNSQPFQLQIRLTIKEFLSYNISKNLGDAWKRSPEYIQTIYLDNYTAYD